MAQLSKTVNASTLDAQESSGTVTVDGGALNANGSSQYIGLIFNLSGGDGIPNSRLIIAASIDVEVTSGSFDDPDLTIYGHKTLTPGAFSASTNDISGRTPTTATVPWVDTGIGTGVRTSPSLVSIIQELVNQTGWTASHSICIILKGNSASSAFRIRAFDAGTGSPATLNVTYADGSIVRRRVNAYTRM